MPDYMRGSTMLGMNGVTSLHTQLVFYVLNQIGDAMLNSLRIW